MHGLQLKRWCRETPWNVHFSIGLWMSSPQICGDVTAQNALILEKSSTERYGERCGDLALAIVQSLAHISPLHRLNLCGLVIAVNTMIMVVGASFSLASKCCSAWKFCCDHDGWCWLWPEDGCKDPFQCHNIPEMLTSKWLSDFVYVAVLVNIPSTRPLSIRDPQTTWKETFLDIKSPGRGMPFMYAKILCPFQYIMILSSGFKCQVGLPFSQTLAWRPDLILLDDRSLFAFACQ